MPSKRSAFLLPGLILFVCLFSFTAYILISDQPELPDKITLPSDSSDIQTAPQSVTSEYANVPNPSSAPSTTGHKQISQEEKLNQEEKDIPAQANDPLSTERETKQESPEEEINYQLTSFTSTDFLVDGSVTSDIGEMAFNSELMPSNEVKLTLTLNQTGKDAVQLVAYFDLAYFRMELDGGNSILNKEHKEILKLTSFKLRPKLERQYRDYDMPEHALMLVQMMDYWSVSPEGFVHEKREIVSQ